MQLEEWQAHPVTHKLHKLCREYKEHLVTHLTKGAIKTTYYERHCAYITGILEGIAFTLEADLLDKEENDDKENTVME